MTGTQGNSDALTLRNAHGVLDARQRSAREKMASLLTPGEREQDFAFQLRLHALTRRRRLVVVTDQRVIFLMRGLLGGFDMQDVQWQDVKDARIKEHFFPALFGADLFINTHDGRKLGIVGAESKQLRRIYAVAQQQEQAWREKNRIRKMEEMRAQAGGVTIAGGGLAGSIAHAGTGGGAIADIMSQLKDAKALFDQGAISDTEYETLKAKLLAGPRG